LALFEVAAVLARPAILALLLHLAAPAVLLVRTDAARLLVAADIGVAIAPADLDPDRRADEAELLPQLIDQEALVGKVKRRRDVGEEDERRRGDADLRGVHDADVLAPRADRRVGGGHRFDELVERRRRDAHAARGCDLVDRLEHARRALAGERRD